ncbi:MAG: hypothetical protein ACWGMZ_10640 [Thermoguttaceae bacterium]
MNNISNEDFAKRVMLLADPADVFEPTATYDPDGDCIEFLAKPDPFFAERIDDLVTVYYSQETNQVIGSLVKGVKKFCNSLSSKLPGFQRVIHDSPVLLSHIFLAKMWSSNYAPNELPTLAYKKLVAISENVEVEGKDLCLA